MKGKESYKNIDPEGWKRREKKKKALKKLHRDRQISRDKRKYISNIVAQTCKKFRYMEDIHLILVVSETNNMEQVLLQAHPMDENNMLLTLPILSLEMQEAYLSSKDKSTDDSNQLARNNLQIFKEMIESYFKVKVSDPIKLLDTPIIVCNVASFSENESLIPSIVRVYDYNLWNNGDFAMALGKNIYSDRRLEEIILTRETPQLRDKHIFAHQDLISQLLLHKACKGKIEFPQSLVNEIKVFSARDGLKRSNFRFCAFFGGTNTFYPDLYDTKKVLEIYGHDFDDDGFSWADFEATYRRIAMSCRWDVEKKEILNLTLPSTNQEGRGQLSIECPLKKPDGNVNLNKDSK